MSLPENTMFIDACCTCYFQPSLMIQHSLAGVFISVLMLRWGDLTWTNWHADSWKLLPRHPISNWDAKKLSNDASSTLTCYFTDFLPGYLSLSVFVLTLGLNSWDTNHTNCPFWPTNAPEANSVYCCRCRALSGRNSTPTVASSVTTTTTLTPSSPDSPQLLPPSFSFFPSFSASLL